MDRIRTSFLTMTALLCRVCLLAPLLPMLLLGMRAVAVCPSMCSCSRGHRTVDCSNRGLSQLPDGLQHNIRFLNVSHNHLQDLDGLLGHFAHLRTLDVSHNRLHKFPSGLPRALWDIRASRNYIRHLDKNDTAYHWNLQMLDLSWNELDRVVFINNTLPALQALNLSHNKFWTMPTNMPHNLQTVDISHNYLLQILPGSLDRLPRLEKFYLHGNRFAWVGEGTFVHLEGLKLLTLGDNPWACDEEENITHLLVWVQQTNARVLGCPCHTRHTCGEAHLATGTWHSYASYTEHPLGTDARNRLLREPSDLNGPSMQAVTSGYLSKWALINPRHQGNGSLSAEVSEQTLSREASTVLPVTPHRGLGAKTSTAAHTRGTKKVIPVRARSTSCGLHATMGQTLASNLFIAIAILKGL
ncbi:oligodendrocyte-myelin glycoprotein [Alosa sapidissima]|uniref:oligodendrocyte-myelin glycoprotein n=1 Tax=Alosa sapidissima TaxID=34773 RepID=UPI001C08C22B|nr:oligodendrocyte-myelin glycoprotein [Alosa sapidissima]